VNRNTDSPRANRPSGLFLFLGLSLFVAQGAVKLLHQVGELLGVFFLNDGLAKYRHVLWG